MEIFKEIECSGWEVSNLGNIKKPNGKLVKFRGQGRRVVKINNKGYKVSKLVGYYFCNPPQGGTPLHTPPGYNLHHINGDRTDDRSDNLSYLTIEEHNAIHKNGDFKHYPNKRAINKKELQQNIKDTKPLVHKLLSTILSL